MTVEMLRLREERSTQQASVILGTPSPRIDSLDSLRGLAAMTVMFHHYLLVYPSIYPYGQPNIPQVSTLLQFTPLHLLWAGYEAVLLFFVLSGFVLSLPYWKHNRFDYGPFILRRWARVWIPYIIAVSLAALVALPLARLAVPGLSVWFGWGWEHPSIDAYLNHVLLIGNLDSNSYGTQFLPVVWSLRYEMIASLAFPVLLFITRTIAWPWVLLLGVALNAVSQLYPASGSFRPLQYILMFLVGILLARHKDHLIARFTAFPRTASVPLLALALVLYLCTWFGWHQDRHRIEVVLLDSGITAGAALAIIIALGSRTANRLLSWRPIAWLGKVSYSIYLMHTLVLLTVVHLLGRSLPIWPLLLACVPLTLLVSWGFYAWVEVPAIRLGRRLSSRTYL